MQLWGLDALVELGKATREQRMLAGASTDKQLLLMGRSLLAGGSIFYLCRNHAVLWHFFGHPMGGNLKKKLPLTTGVVVVLVLIANLLNRL